jgi:two-component system sensor kinase Ihk
MKIFPKTFLYTLALLVLIAGLANGLIYTLLPKVYTSQKQNDLTEQTDHFVEQLEDAKRDEIIDLMARYADILQANLVIKLGDDSYSMLTWNGGVITQIDDSADSGAAKADEAPDSDPSDKTVTVVEGSVQSISDTASAYAEAGGAGYQSDSTLTGIVTSGTAGSKIIEAQRSFTLAGEEGTLLATLTLAPVEEAVQVIVSLLPISLILCLVIAIVFSLFFARAITRPIKAISDETRHMTLLEREARCKIKSKDEFGALAANVNGLYENLLSTIASLEAELKKVAAAEKAKTDFLRAASHELKTPATAVGVIMDNMILGVGKYKNHDEWLQKCRELVDSLSGKLREILDASHLEEISEPYVTESLETVCSEVLEPYILIARARGLSLYVDWSASFPVTAPPELLGKALSNIFANAVQYTAPGGKLSVYCKGRSLVVENECEPIPEDQLKRLCEPFYRPDVSRSRETGGNGLGLYIVETILRRLELDYRIEPMTSPEGMRFTIYF